MARKNNFAVLSCGLIQQYRNKHIMLAPKQDIKGYNGFMFFLNLSKKILLLNFKTNHDCFFLHPFQLNIH